MTTGKRDEVRKDIEEQDLHPLLTRFYEMLDGDPLLRSYFEELDMTAHMPRIVDFWSAILFQTRRYNGNAFLPHQRMPGLTSAHFARWMEVLERTVDDRHSGPAAERMKAMAHRIAYSMQLRLGISPFAPYRLDERAL